MEPEIFNQNSVSISCRLPGDPKSLLHLYPWGGTSPPGITLIDLSSFEWLLELYSWVESSIRLYFLISSKITGGTGFIGSHIVYQLLVKGFKVKAWAYPCTWPPPPFWNVLMKSGRNKEKLQSIFPSVSPDQLEIIQLPGLTSESHTEALKGVDALIQCAAPSYRWGDSPEEILRASQREIYSQIETDIRINLGWILWICRSRAICHLSRCKEDHCNKFSGRPYQT